MSFMNDFEHLKIQLQDIRSATNDFQDKPIGIGGFGKVYKGELSFPDEGSCMVAFKRLDRKCGQGDVEFWKEVMMLSQCRHENLISLLRFCHEGPERILVYEYASRGSLDRYLGDASLTWTQRLKICLGAANGLNYLHDPINTPGRVLHRDIKSSNILLDENWNAKVSDFGLSKHGPANQQYTYLVSNVVGTPGYCDPLYWETGVLSKESDVYSFGVVLFEVLCGRLCFEYCNGELRVLIAMWKECYYENKLDDIMFRHTKEQVDADSLITFSSIANRCLNRDRKERPTMGEIVEKLEIALDEQMFQDVGERIIYEERKKIADQAVTALSYRSRKELRLLLSKGVVLNEGKTWFSLNKDGNNCEVISAKGCMFTRPGRKTYTSRFQVSPVFYMDSEFQLDVSTQFLSVNVTYTINLVYTHKGPYEGLHNPFKYKLDVETRYSRPCVVMRRGDDIFTQLYQFTSHRKQHDFRIQLTNQDSKYTLILLGIEFMPMEHIDKKEQSRNETDDIEWEQKLTSDYTEIIKWSKYSMQWTSKKELYYILRKGFLIDKNGEKWFSISKNMKKRYMQPWRAILQEKSIPGRGSLARREDWVYSIRKSRLIFDAQKSVEHLLYSPK